MKYCSSATGSAPSPGRFCLVMFEGGDVYRKRFEGGDVYDRLSIVVQVLLGVCP